MNNNLLFTTSTELIRVPSDYIVYIVAAGNYSTIKMANGEEYVLTLQLGQMEERIAAMVELDDNRFIRIGKSLIVNLEYVTYIHPSRQRIILSDGHSFRYELAASKEVLKELKKMLEEKETKR